MFATALLNQIRFEIRKHWTQPLKSSLQVRVKSLRCRDLVMLVYLA